MATNPRLYSTTALLGVLLSLKRPQRFLLDKFFAFEVTSDKEEIAFDVELHDEQLAPFVAPTVEGEIVMEDGFKTEVFTPAYIKIKTPLSPYKSLKRSIGETIGSGTLTAGQRSKLRLAYTMVKHQNRIIRRMEAMASEVLREGRVTISGEKYQERVVDFGRAAELRVTLVGTDKWGQAGSDPIQDLEDWAQNVFDASGAIVEDVVMGSKAWNAFRNDEKVQKLLDLRRATGGGPLMIGPAAPVMDGAVFVGTLGSFNIFKYNASYQNAAKQRVRVLPENGVLGVATSAYAGIRYFGAIMDEEANLGPLQYFMKSWLNPDPSVRMIMTQVAPLLAPGRKDANYYSTVCD